MNKKIDITLKNGELIIPATIISNDETGELKRIILKDPSQKDLEFPFTTVLSASEYLCDEYEIELDYATTLLTELVKVNIPLIVAKESTKTESDHTSSQSDWQSQLSLKDAGLKTETTVAVQTFELAGKEVTKNVRTKSINANPTSIEELELDTVYKLKIESFSKKSRICELYRYVGGAEVEKEIFVTGVVLYDAILKYAELSGMSFKQADDHIKGKRGLIPEKGSVRKSKSATQNGFDLLSKIRR